MAKSELLYEGKAKQIYATDNPKIVRIKYKDSATAFNGEKKEVGYNEKKKKAYEKKG